MAKRQSRSSKNIILIIFFLFLAAFVIRIVFFSVPNSQKEPPEEPPDFKELMRVALLNYEEAESALIYKDIDKVKKLLQDAKENAQKITDPSDELYGEAQKLLRQVRDKEAEVKELEKKSKENEPGIP